MSSLHYYLTALLGCFSIQPLAASALPGSIAAHASSGQFSACSSWSQCTAASRCCRKCHYSLAFPFWQPEAIQVGTLECKGFLIAQSTSMWGILLFLLRTFGSPSSCLVACSLCRDSDDLSSDSFQCLTTVLVQLYFVGTSSENLKYALLELVLDLP